METKLTDKSYQEVLHWASYFLNKHGVESFVAMWLMKERFELSMTDWVMVQKKRMSSIDYCHYQKDIKQAAKHYPPQYIIGREWFMNRPFQVNEATLIPRPETEEWFDRYIKTLSSKPLTIIDVGTGSGVLGISHKLARGKDTVYLSDISTDALTVAKRNAEALQADVQLLTGDGLTPAIKQGIKADIIISNPPYIAEDEWEDMDESVRTYEPKLALFAKKNGLAMYHQLANQAQFVLNNKGQLVVEIGYKQAQAVRQIFQESFPQSDVDIWTDLSGLDRVVRVKLS